MRIRNLKFISLFVVLAMLLPFVTAAAAPGDALLTVGSAVAQGGDSLEVTLSLTQNPGMAYAKLLITYDKDALTFDSAQNGQVFDGLTKGAFLVFYNTGNTAKTGTLATLKFTVKDGAANNSYDIKAVLQESYNEEEDDVNWQITNGKVTVSPQSGLSVSVESVSAEPGENVNVVLTVTGNPGVSFAKYMINYDKTALTLTGADNGEVFDGLTKGAFLVFFNTGNTDKTGTLATLHFAVSNGAQSKEYPITVTCTEAYNEKEEDVAYTISNGTLTVIGTETVSVNITWGDMEFTYSDGSWNSETHQYEGTGWAPDTADGNKITVENAGNVGVDVSFSYSGVINPISAGFSDGEKSISSAVSLAAGETKSVWLLLYEKPNSNLDNTKLGTVTVTLGGQ